MRIVLTGGGTGGHFYPLIAVAQSLRNIHKERHLAKSLTLYYCAPDPYNAAELKKHDIIFKKIPAGKKRIYKSKKAYLELIKASAGIAVSIVKIFLIYPDIIFSKGGYASFPVLVSARILGIPVFIHESDTVPGRVNLWSGKFAKRIATSWPQAVSNFPKDKAAATGQPIRKELQSTIQEGSHEYFSFDPNIPTITVLGGSQGAQRINDIVIDTLPTLLEKYQIIHQTGATNLKATSDRVRITLERNDHKNRYHAEGFMNSDLLKRAVGISSLMLTRSGSVLFEIAQWGIPAILIPIPETISRDQTSNAFAYAREGAGTVLEEQNLTPHILIAEIDKILGSREVYEKLSKAAFAFAKTDAADKIAGEILEIIEKHE